MGEVADMMLDGTLCEGCGEFLGSDYGPAYCASCAKDRGRIVMSVSSADPLHGVEKPNVPKVACPTCGKFVKVTGIGDHWRQVHDHD
jgi:hypothetical protein